jgi:hypothetical protein
MRRLLLLAAIPLLACAEDWKGTIIDVHCQGMDPAIHERSCALHNAKKGLGLAMPGGRFLKFDKKGTAKALEAIQATPQENLAAEVKGTLKGDTIQVESVRVVATTATAAAAEHCPMMGGQETMSGHDHGAAQNGDCCPKCPTSPKQ